jgi:hypothetical protein
MSGLAVSGNRFPWSIFGRVFDHKLDNVEDEAACAVTVTVVSRWQARFMAEGLEGLLRDKTRKPGKPQYSML